MSFDLQNTRKNKILPKRGGRTVLNSIHDVEMCPKWCPSGAQVKRIHTKVVKKPFSWRLHFSAYSVCPDKSFWRGKKSS